MTGHRGAKGQPLAEDARAQRREEHFRSQLDVASTPWRRVHAVVVYLEAALKRAEPSLAAAKAEEAARALLAIAAEVEVRCRS